MAITFGTFETIIDSKVERMGCKWLKWLDEGFLTRERWFVCLDLCAAAHGEKVQLL